MSTRALNTPWKKGQAPVREPGCFPCAGQPAYVCASHWALAIQLLALPTLCATLQTVPYHTVSP